MEKKWFQRSYRRNLVDMHISDWDERFLSKFDPKEYVDMMTLAGVTGVMMYSSSCVGHCNYPTKVGHMHRGLKGRDILGEVINLCHQRGMDVIMYYLTIDTKCGYVDPPDWRAIDAEGRQVEEGSRYGARCLNSPYRDFALAQIEELCKNYEFEGIFIDMISWPIRGDTGVCYCPYCRKRYAAEIGGQPPEIINWEDPKWVKFQRKREEWLEEFCSLVTSTIKKLKPEVSVELQSAGYFADWQYGVTERLAKQNDYLGGDFYGGPEKTSFVCKLFYNLTESMPFEFMVSRCPDLSDHTTMKSKELLKAQVYSALANNGAFLFIDAIDPVGTLNKDVYEEVGEIFKETKKYEKYLGGELCQDFGVYFSFESRINFKDNGKKVTEVSRWDWVLRRGPIYVSHSLLNEHIPFGVITKKNLKDLSSYQVIILPNLLMIDEEEVKALKEFVNSGGSLYASKYTSLLTKDGERKSDFLLSDLFGVSYVGETKEEVTYISPTKEGKDIFLPYSAEYPLTIFGSQVKVKAKKGAKVLATITLPYTNPKDIDRFASIHSNPPGFSTDCPSVVLNEYGKGKVLYVAADLEVAKQEPHRLVFTNLIKMFSSKPLSFETDAPKSVEITLFHQKDKRRYLINLLNFQAELPNIPVEGIKVRIRLDKKEPKRLIKLPEGKELAYEIKKGYVEFISPRIETFLMLALDYR